MRKIGIAESLLFGVFFVFFLFAAFVFSLLLLGAFPLGDFRGLTLVTATIVLGYLYAFLVYRLFLRVRPLREGEIMEKSKEEFGYHVFLLFYLILFYPLMRSGFMPVTLMRLVYLDLVDRFGANSYSSCFILDPPFIEIGSNSIVGQYNKQKPQKNKSRRLA